MAALDRIAVFKGFIYNTVTADAVDSVKHRILVVSGSDEYGFKLFLN